MVGARTAVIFFNEEKFFQGIPCFGVRFDKEKLPKDSIVVGFMKLSNTYAVESLLAMPEPPSTQQTLELSRNYALRLAEATLKGDLELADDLKKSGFVL